MFAVESRNRAVGLRQQVRVQTDHMSLVSIFKSRLISAPKRLKSILLRLVWPGYHLQKKGAEMVLADTLSRAYRVPSQTERTASKTLQGETERDVRRSHQNGTISTYLWSYAISDASRNRSRLHSARDEDSNPTRLASAEIGICRMHPWLLPI